MRILRKPHPVAMFFAWFLTVFLVLFPKGGIKTGGLPLTWGYMFLAVTTPPLLLVRLLALPLRMPLRLWAAIAMLLPIQLLCVYSMVFYGILDKSFAVSTLAAFFFLPWIFLLVYPPFFRFIDGDRFSKYLRWSVLLAALWGIFLFFWHPITGHYIEIPYLTVNVEDVGQLETTKNIARGLFFKLISTYNNGNLYGVATLMLVPLYDRLEKVRWRRIVVKIALLLTLSRTVWAGMIIAEVLSLTVVLLHQLDTFPRLYLNKAAKRVGTLFITVCFIFASLLLNSSRLAFLLDPTLGNRTGMMQEIFTASFLPTHGLFGFREVLYSSAAVEFGYVGLLAFILLMMSPVLLLFIDSTALQSPIRRAALKGLIIYAFVAGSDGGFNFIPTMAFYWFVYMIYLFGWPATSAAARSVLACPGAKSVADCRPILEAAH